MKFFNKPTLDSILNKIDTNVKPDKKTTVVGVSSILIYLVMNYTGVETSDIMEAASNPVTLFVIYLIPTVLSYFTKNK